MIKEIIKKEKGIEVIFDRQVTIVKIEEESIELSDGTNIYSFHDQDCCEHHWADFSVLEVNPDHKNPFDKLDFKGVEGLGFLMNGMLVNGYGDNNGYYSSNLDLVVTDGNTVYEWDISDYQEEK